MTKTSIVGYPRVGSQRELKFWIEDYFKGKLSASELQQNAEGLVKSQWEKQKQSGLDFIPSNDFSFYDGVLDTACLLGVVPRAYKELGLDWLDTYFAMARGYQGIKGDRKALPMRKWFNTNYHYILPEFDDDVEIKVNSQEPFEQYLQALAAGVATKPVLIGPFTLLMLGVFNGSKKREDYVQDIIVAYKEIFGSFNALGCEWIQLDEPSLVIDLSATDQALFRSIYGALLTGKDGLKVLLQTYFGDVRDAYGEIVSMGFDGIGLDFIEGTKTLEIMKQYGFPKDTLLFAGIVNGKNIWRNDYSKTLALLNRLTEFIDKENIVISISCSLLHVPYSVENETKLDSDYMQHFAFAEEKLKELSELKKLFEDPDYQKRTEFINNSQLIKSKAEQVDTQVRDILAALIDRDFIRHPEFLEREQIQRDSLGLPLLPTTTIGSFPQTAEGKLLRAKLRRCEITADDYKQQMKQRIADCIALQEEIGLDVLVHGEFERNDMVEYFGQNLDGFLFTKNAWVQSYGTRCVKPPIIWGDIKRKGPITVEYSAFAQGLTDKPVKGMITGPVTILNWSFPREDVSNRDMAMQIALAIKEEACDLEAAGIRIIQVDEAALKEKLPLRRADWHSEYLDWAIPAFRLVHSSLKPETQVHTHMCYSEFDEIIKEIDDMDADVISFEAARSNLSIVDALVKAGFKTQVGPGVYDIHSSRVPCVEEISDAINKMLASIAKKKLWVNPDCGLKTRSETEAIQSLRNMVTAAKRIKNSLW